MRVAREELLGSLSAVKSGLGGGGTVEDLDFVVFRDGRAWAYDGEVLASFPSPIGASAIVPATKLIEILTRRSDAEIEIEIGDTRMQLSGDSGRSGLSFPDEADAKQHQVLNSVKMPTDGAWKVLPDRFLEALELTVPVVGSDNTRPLLSCVHLGDGLVESCDNFRVTRVVVDGMDADLNIPSRAARELLGMEPLEWSFLDGWAHFRSESGLWFSALAMDGRYPDLSQHLAVEGSKVRLPRGIEAALKRAAVFADVDVRLDGISRGRSGTVIVSLSRERCSIRGRDETGFHEEDVDARWKGDDVEFRVNPEWFALVASRIRTCTVGEKRLMFDGDGWRHVVSTVVPRTSSVEEAGE